MDLNTFGDSNRYKTLEFITDKIQAMPKSRRSHMTMFFKRFNSICHQLDCLQDKPLFRAYFLDLTKKDYKEKISKLDKYDEEFKSYLQNYVHARLSNTKRKC